jgi:RNA polymerase II subunit A-like phosphatase
MSHHHAALTVSQAEAERLESQTTTRLLASKKLSLIVDLDQTIVHATVDPTVGEWLQDPKNPNHTALADVFKFKLGMNGSSVRDEDEGCWYYIKHRPGLKAFLEQAALMYEMHVYTMGTRNYAEAVCKGIDPDGHFFGGRILSRDESGSACGLPFVI